MSARHDRPALTLVKPVDMVTKPHQPRVEPDPCPFCGQDRGKPETWTSRSVATPGTLGLFDPAFCCASAEVLCHRTVNKAIQKQIGVELRAKPEDPSFARFLVWLASLTCDRTLD